MALFGRESDAERDRAERVGQWARQRSPLALASLLFGLLAIVDAVTGVLGLVFGAAAITTGALARRHLAREPHLKGAKIATAGIALGIGGLLLGAAVWVVAR